MFITSVIESNVSVWHGGAVWARRPIPDRKSSGIRGNPLSLKCQREFPGISKIFFMNSVNSDSMYFMPISLFLEKMFLFFGNIDVSTKMNSIPQVHYSAPNFSLFGEWVSRPVWITSDTIRYDTLDLRALKS